MTLYQLLTSNHPEWTKQVGLILSVQHFQVQLTAILCLALLESSEDQLGFLQAKLDKALILLEPGSMYT